MRKISHRGPSYGWIPPTRRQMTRAFFIIDPNEKLSEGAKEVTKYIIENPSGPVDGIYEGVSNLLGQDEVKNAVGWLDYLHLISVTDREYSVDQTNLKILKNLLKR